MRNYALLEKSLYLLKKQNLSFLEVRALRLFIGYNRSFLKSILSSSISYKEKKSLCFELYNNKGWKIIFQQYPIYQMPISHRIIIFLIKHRLFNMNYILYKLLFYFNK